MRGSVLKKNERKALSLGLLMCLGACGIFGIIALFPKVDRHGMQELRVAFTHIGGANKGMSVCLAGKSIGCVTAIHNIIDKGLADSQDQIYAYELVLKIDSSVSIREGDQIVLYSPKLISEPIINIIPSKFRESTPCLTASHLAFGNNIDPVEKIIHFVDRADQAITSLHQGCSQTLARISDLLDHSEQVSVVQKTLDVLASVQEGANRLSDLLNAKHSEEIGQLLEDAKEVTSFMRDYGLLYQYNSQWKRAQKFQDKMKIPQEIVVSK